MRIKELHIKAFGRFADRALKLEDNLNILYGLNEKGKSTLHRFIEAMFFGLVKPGVKRRVVTEEYDLYRPWTGGLYGGSLVYRAGGRLYKVERNLQRGRESVRVFDHITGEDLTGEFAYDKARREVLFAREHLGLGQTAYRNTISISQLGSKSDRSLAREIQTRLGNLSRAGDASLSVDRAEKLISEYLDGIGTDRAYTKEYGRLCRRVEELEEGLQKAAEAADSVKASGRQLREMEKEAAAVKAKKEELETRIKALEQMAEQDRREVQRICSKIEETSRDIEEAKTDLAKAGGEGEWPVRRRYNVGLGLCAVSAAAIIGAVLLASALENSSLYILFIPASGLFIYSIARTVRQKKLLGEREAASRALVTELQFMERYRQDLINSLAANEGELAEREETAATASIGLTGAMAYTAPRREHLAYQKAQLERIREEEMGLLGSIEKVRGSMETLEQATADLPGMEEELSGARERLRQLKLEREAAEIALETLREASAGVHREFAPALNTKVNEITSRITGGRYSDLNLTKELEILATAPETGRRVEAEALSGGTVDQLYFALRVAAAELVSGGKKLPLILDDCFVQYDTRRLENVMEYLFEEARERQIILFTCHERERRIADAIGKVYNYLVID